MKTVSGVAALAVAMTVLASCSGAGSAGSGAPSRATSASASSGGAASSQEAWLDKRVPVGGGRELHATCWGHGSPPVLFLHGRIMPADDASFAHRPDLRERIAQGTTYCEYERVNVGTSSTESGPIPLTESAADLNALLDGVGIGGRVVLVGGSYGGVLATLFAGTYPERLAGAVLLDPELAAPPALPGCRDTNLDHYVPPEFRLTPSSWRDNAEQTDDFHASALAARVLDRIPRVPGVLFGATRDNYPPGTEVKPFMSCLRVAQRSLAARFRPGQLFVLEAGHSLEGYTDRIAATVLGIVRAS